MWWQGGTATSYVDLVRSFASLLRPRLQSTNAQCSGTRHFVARIQFSNFNIFKEKRCFSISWQYETSKCSDNFHVSDVVAFWWIVWRVVQQIVRDFSDEEMLRLWRLGDFIRGWVRRLQNRAIVNFVKRDIWLGDDLEDCSDRENGVELSLALKEEIVK